MKLGIFNLQNKNHTDVPCYLQKKTYIQGFPYSPYKSWCKRDCYRYQCRLIPRNFTTFFRLHEDETNFICTFVPCAKLMAETAITIKEAASKSICVFVL